MNLFLAALCVLVAVCASVKIPPNFRTCNRKHPNFKSCLLKAANYGARQFRQPYRQLKMFSLEPLEILEASAGLQTPLVNTSQILRNCKVWGLTNVTFSNFDFDFAKRTVDIAGIFPELRGDCQYVIDGRIMFIPIKGDGISSTVFKNYYLSFHLNYVEFQRKNKTYVKEVSSQLDGRPDSITFKMENLFGGDEVLTARVNRFLNENWSELYDDAKESSLRGAKQMFLKVFDGWFSRVSLEEAFDN